MVIWLVLLITSVVHSDKIMHEENLAIKSDCGSHYLRQRHSRSIGATKANTNEFPWIAALLKRREWQVDKLLCSAVQISQKHLLTAAHCVVRTHYNMRRCNTAIKKRVGQKNDTTVISRRRFVPMRANDLIAIVGSACSSLANKKCRSRRNRYRVSQVLVHPNYDPCMIGTDLALVVLRRDISSRDGSPICLPSRNESTPTTMMAVGFGLYSHSSTNRLRSMNLTVNYHNESRIVTKAMGSSFCQGDSGGPLVEVDGNDTYTVIGIGSGSKPSCTNRYRYRSNINFTDVFESVQPHVDWICKNTGVCHVTESDQASKWEFISIK